jgi:hypothetical protein
MIPILKCLKKGSSLKEWQGKLIEYSNKFSLIGESVYWHKINKVLKKLQINFRAATQ